MDNTLPQNTPHSQGRASNYGKVKEQIEAMLRLDVPYKEIVSTLHCSIGTISYHAKRLNLRDIDKGKSGCRYDWEAIQQYHDEGHNYIECAQKFGFSLSSWNTAVRYGRIINRDSIELLENLLVENGYKIAGHQIKERLISTGILKYECSICGISEWNGKPLTLQLDHINGNNKDNRLENLRILCPNCHTQTETYGGKNKKNRSIRSDGKVWCAGCKKFNGSDDFYPITPSRKGKSGTCKECAKRKSRDRRASAKVSLTENVY